MDKDIRDNLPTRTETVAVTSYDLLAQEVDAAQMRIPAREALPEGEGIVFESAIVNWLRGG